MADSQAILAANAIAVRLTVDLSEVPARFDEIAGLVRWLGTLRSVGEGDSDSSAAMSLLTTNVAALFSKGAAPTIDRPGASGVHASPARRFGARKMLVCAGQAIAEWMHKQAEQAPSQFRSPGQEAEVRSDHLEAGGAADDGAGESDIANDEWMQELQAELDETMMEMAHSPACDNHVAICLAPAAAQSDKAASMVAGDTAELGTHGTVWSDFFSFMPEAPAVRTTVVFKVDQAQPDMMVSVRVAGHRDLSFFIRDGDPVFARHVHAKWVERARLKSAGHIGPSMEQVLPKDARPLTMKYRDIGPALAKICGGAHFWRNIPVF